MRFRSHRLASVRMTGTQRASHCVAREMSSGRSRTRGVVLFSESLFVTTSLTLRRKQRKWTRWFYPRTVCPGPRCLTFGPECYPAGSSDKGALKTLARRVATLNHFCHHENDRPREHKSTAQYQAIKRTRCPQGSRAPNDSASSCTQLARKSQASAD